MSPIQRLPIFADEEMGRVGYYEKQWFYPTRRQQCFLKHLKQSSYWDSVHLHTSHRATDDELLLFHTKTYIEDTLEKCAQNTGVLGDGATLARAHMERAARHVVGAVLEAMQNIVSGKWSRAFIPIAGFHHATSTSARMYCLYNDCAIAIQYALQSFSGNIGYIDTDVHFGDGVYDAFADHPRVISSDIHEADRTLFPYTPEKPGSQNRRETSQLIGEGAARGRKQAFPLSPFHGDKDYQKYMQKIEEHMAIHQPAFILLNCGLDAMEGDPMAHQHLSEEGIYNIARAVRKMANQYSQGRLLVLGGGGYLEKNLGHGWCSVVRALL
ncbi:MAG: hypothetical protein VX278_16900 [Myxococcota bacterium]|nr:hypothetical protein [Myxococcota bacterium]